MKGLTVRDGHTFVAHPVSILGEKSMFNSCFWNSTLSHYNACKPMLVICLPWKLTSNNDAAVLNCWRGQTKCYGSLLMGSNGELWKYRHSWSPEDDTSLYWWPTNFCLTSPSGQNLSLGCGAFDSIACAMGSQLGIKLFSLHKQPLQSSLHIKPTTSVFFGHLGAV